MKPKVLYIAAGNPVAPRMGMDIVVREHLCELMAHDAIDVTGVFVVPAGWGSDAPVSPWPNVRGFSGDAPINIISKIAHILRGGTLAYYSFVSAAARRYIERELEKNYDLVIVEHVMATVNLSLHRLPKKTRLIFIGQDVAAHVIAAAGMFKKSWMVRLFYRFQALQAWRFDRALVRRADASIFLSEWDRQHFDDLKPRYTFALCPAMIYTHDKPMVRTVVAPRATAVFIGTAKSAFNKFALDWIVEKLALQLAQLAPDVTITLVGEGTHGLAAGKYNIDAMGFVPEQELTALLQNSLCVLSPVIHGGGIKIKVLEAIRAACPVIATEQSLRGYEFMGIAPAIKIDDPRAAAEAIAALARDPAATAKERARMAAVWEAYKAERAGRLNRIVSDVLKAG